MGFARAWKPNGDVLYSAAAEKRDGRASPLSFRASTQAHNDGFGFPRRNKLTRSPDIQTVIREGKRIRTAHLDVRVLASPFSSPRIGIVVPRHQHSAVDRNRLKRRLRDMVRIELLPALRERPPIDVAIRARHEAYGAPIQALWSDVRSIQTRLAHDGGGVNAVQS